MNPRTTVGSPPLAGELEGVETETLSLQLRKSHVYYVFQQISTLAKLEVLENEEEANEYNRYLQNR